MFMSIQPDSHDYKLEHINNSELDNALGRFALYTLFSSAYGDSYRGNDALDKKIAEADGAFLLTHMKQIGAGCLVGGGRITTIGTSAEKDFSDRRFHRMVTLLSKLREESEARWMSIGLEYDKMQAAAEQSGMYPIESGHTAISLLEEIGEVDKYRVTSGGNQPVVMTKTSNGYQQNMWQW